MKQKLNKQIFDTMSKDLGNWRGPFYFNKKDPRLVVPKLNPSLGWTFNFASPYPYLILVGIVLILLLVNIFM